MTPKEDIQHMHQLWVDRDLIRMFRKLTPEQRILSNDNAINAIAQLRNAFKKQRISANRSKGADRRKVVNPVSNLFWWEASPPSRRERPSPHLTWISYIAKTIQILTGY